MKPRSLRLRLAAASAVSIGVAVLLAGLGLAALFERHVVRRVNAELETYVRQLSGHVSIGADGAITIGRPLVDARFSEPLSGLYWQVDDDTTGTRLRSRSLWDHVLALPADPLETGSVHHHRLAGPRDASLLVAERRVILASPGQPHNLRIAAGLDAKDVAEARAEFAQDMVKSLVLLAGILLTAAWVQIVVGLKPLESLRNSVAGVRSGATSRLDVAEPEEVLPLVVELNALLDEKAKTIEKAKTRAADLAHGLKTPLTVLVSDADRLRQKGERDIAAEIEDIAAGMQRHVERELARARMQARAHRPDSPSTTSVAEAVDRLVRVLSRSPEGSKLDWHVEVDDEVRVAVVPEDLSELLGAILENASKWARSIVVITADNADPVQISIIDDGPGVPDAKLAEIGARGVRLDQKVEGTGLGLAIATDIAEAYGGRINIEKHAPHGLRVDVTLPRSLRQVRE